MRNGEVLAVFLVGAAMVIGASLALGQGPPSPGPTKPPAAGRPQTDIVINPTVEECRAGWQPGIAWTKEQFESFCAKMKAAK